MLEHILFWKEKNDDKFKNFDKIIELLKNI
jgi:hypothetical protein